MINNHIESGKVVGFTKYEQDGRPKGDFYATPSIAVDKLLSAVKFAGPVLEPCCGNGAISEILIKNGYPVISQDLHDWGYGETNVDFLKQEVQDVGAVVTNPPFNLSTEFTLKSLECVRKSKGKVAILNRLQWLEGIKRQKLFKENNLSKVLVFSKRIPRFNRFDYAGKQGTSMLAFAWFIFDLNYNGEIVLDFI